MTRMSEKDYARLTGRVITKNRPSTSLGVDSYKSNVQGWRTIGGKKYYFKSLYEINYARVLEFLKQHKSIKDWEYEPTVFEFPKDQYKASPFYYKPDFFVTLPDTTHQWHEVKGWMNPTSRAKLKRFAKHYPQEVIIIIDKDWFKQHAKNYKRLIPGWESLPSKR